MGDKGSTADPKIKVEVKIRKKDFMTKQFLSNWTALIIIHTKGTVYPVILALKLYVRDCPGLSVHRLCLVSQLRSTEVNEAEMQNRTQPVDRPGAVFGSQQPCFPIMDNPVNLGCALKKLLGAD